MKYKSKEMKNKHCKTDPTYRFPVRSVLTSSETRVSFCSVEQFSYTSDKPLDVISWVISMIEKKKKQM